MKTADTSPLVDAFRDLRLRTETELAKASDDKRPELEALLRRVKRQERQARRMS